jgi:hypothetical protein
MRSLDGVRTTLTTEVLATDGTVLASVTLVSETESCGNPMFVTRTAQRRAEEVSDRTRKMLGAEFGEPEESWR